MENEIIKEFIKDFYNYTTTISITEDEYFGNFEWLENYISHREITREDYIKEAYKDILYDLIFNQKAIKKQIETDISIYGNDSGEMKYIKYFYNKWNKLFDFKINFEK